MDTDEQDNEEGLGKCTALKSHPENKPNGSAIDSARLSCSVSQKMRYPIIKLHLLVFVFLMTVFISACSSGLRPSFGSGKIVPPSELLQYCGTGSLSTLWYYGSDTKYHYFGHYAKVTTRYRVNRDELHIPAEFAHKSKDPVFIGAAGFWKDVEKKGRG